MRFEQAKDIVRHAIDMHQMIERHFLSLSGRAVDPRMKMVADYMVKREAFLQVGLTEFERFAEKAFNETWFEFSVCDARFKQLHGYLQAAEALVDDVLDLIIQLYECIAGVFEALSKEADVGEVREVFANISEMEKRELKKMVRNIQMMNEL